MTMVAIPTVALVKGDEVRIVNAGSVEEADYKKDGYEVRVESQEKEAKKEVKKVEKPKGNTFV
tara:strand:+ start:108 stop:296 length:189 start_codon:yes stop_codon:yes gene_type:complete